ncbi:transposase family protein [Mucilaginibacter sp.]|uniref:transposase family protein n=1 Tax=Mucilaginibacter sp. TaxID=1882438 RepID=UPI0025ECB7B0|nr:transposase family protein [Mucilaginibacter sp.]
MKRQGYKEVLISVSELIKLTGDKITSKSILANCMRSNATEKSISWINQPDPLDGRKINILYSTIPKQTILKYALPPVATLIDQIKHDAALEKSYTQQQQIEFKEDTLTRCIKGAATDGYTKHCAFYNKQISGKKENVKRAKVIELSKTHAVLLCCADLKAGRGQVVGYKISELHEAYLNCADIKHSLKNPEKFRQKINDIPKNGLNLLHAFACKPREYLVKLTDWHKGTITKYYMDGNQYTHKQIHELLFAECLAKKQKPVKYDTVSKYLSRQEVKNTLAVFRNPDFFKRTVKPHTRREKAIYAGDLYYGDGTPIQIFSRNEAGTKDIKLNIFLIMDVMSGKIVGYDFAESEDRFNWFAAFKMAFYRESLLPYELMCDQASVTKTSEYKTLKERLEIRGCRLTTTTKGEPQQKGNIERVINTLQSSCQRMIDGYIGEGIRSRRDNGRIDTKHLNDIKKAKGFYNYESIVTIMVELISIYNNKPVDDRLAPFDAFNESEKPNIAAICEADLAVMFWHSKQIKVVKSEIQFDIKKQTHIYDLYSHDLGLKYNNQKVNVFYDENDLKSVHLFDLNGDYICECKPKIHIVQAKANQTEGDVLNIIKQSSHNEAMTATAKRKANDIMLKAAENDADFAELLDPFKVNKELYNNAETQKDLEYIYQQKNINQQKVVPYEPVASNIKIIDKQKKKAQERHAKKNIVAATLEVVGTQRV